MLQVTEILSVLSRYEGVNRRLLSEHAKIGSEAHAQVLTHLKGHYLPPPKSKTVLNLRDRTLAWCDLMISEVIGVEVRYEIEKYGIIGHIDLVCTLKGYGNRRFIIDLKYVVKVDWICWLQMAAYKKIYMIKKGGNPGRRILWVPKGRDKIKLLESPCSFRDDLIAFLNAKALYQRRLIK